MKKKTACHSFVLLVFGICLLCGCGGKSASSGKWWLNLSDTVSKEKEDTQTEENTTEHSKAPEELSPGYWEFHYLCGLGKEEVQNVLGKEWKDGEEKFDEYVVYTIGDVEYWFFKEVDALCSIQYTNLDAGEAEQLASDCYREMMIRYGDDSTYPLTHRIRDIVLTMEDDLERGVKEQNIDQYSEAWRQPYTREMEEKVKDYYATDKVKLSLSLLTPLFMDQGSYTVSISHMSANLSLMRSNGNE